MSLAEGGLSNTSSNTDKGSIIFTIVELLLIALLLLCNCLNLVSVLGFGTSSSAKSESVVLLDSTAVASSFEEWQRSLMGEAAHIAAELEDLGEQ